MSLKKNKDLKLYFSISEVAQMFDVNESTLHQSKEDEQRYPFLQAGGYRRGTPHLPSG